MLPTKTTVFNKNEAREKKNGDEVLGPVKVKPQLSCTGLFC